MSELRTRLVLDGGPSSSALPNRLLTSRLSCAAREAPLSSPADAAAGTRGRRMGTLGELLLVLGLASELLLPPIGKSARARRAASLEAMAVAALAARRFAGTSTRRGPSPYWRCGGEAASSDEEGDENGMGGIANGNADGTCGALARARSHEAELAPKRGLQSSTQAVIAIQPQLHGRILVDSLATALPSSHIANLAS